MDETEANTPNEAGAEAETQPRDDATEEEAADNTHNEEAEEGNEANEENNDNVQEEEQAQEAGNQLDYLWWDGEMPQPTGRLATYWSQNGGSPAGQRTRTTAIYQAVSNTPPAINGLSRSKKPNLFLASVPGSTNVRVIYGLEGIFDANSFIDDIQHFKIMSGEIPEGSTSHPTVYTLPADVFNKIQVTVPSNAYIQEHGAEWNDTHYYFKTERQVMALPPNQREEVEVMAIAPVPIFCTYDVIGDDTDAKILWERFGSLDEAETDDCIIHLRHFLKACMMKFNQRTHCPQLTIAPVWVRRPSTQDSTWAEARIRHIYPEIMAPTNAHDNNRRNGNTNMLGGLTPEVLRQVLAIGAEARELTPPRRNIANRFNDAEGEKEDAEPKTLAEQLGVSKETMKNIARFCRLKDDEFEKIPEYLKVMHGKKMTAQDQLHILVTQILDFRDHTDIDIHLPASVLAPYREHNYAGTCDPNVTYHNCTKGISILGLKLHSDEKRGEMELDAECLQLATVTTASDYKKQQTSIKPEVPTTWEKFKGFLCRLIDITGPLSEKQAMMYEDARDALEDLCRWPETARRQLTQKDYAHIMWAFTVQNRYYFLDPRAIRTPRHPAFELMLHSLKSQQVFSMMGVPPQLIPDTNTGFGGGGGVLTSPTKRKAMAGTTTDSEGGRKRDKPSHIGQDFTHPFIKQALGREWDKLKEKKVKLGQLCKCYGIKPARLVPEGKCANAQIFGTCTYWKCNRDHGKLDDAQARNSIDLLKPFINNPNKLWLDLGINEG